MTGFCHPGTTCGGEVSECTSEFNLCLSDFLVGVWESEQIEYSPGGSPCVASGCPATQCQSGYQCLKTALALLGEGASTAAPDICTPTCGQDGSCPPGFRCLRSFIEDVMGEDPGESYEVCFPGVPWLETTCKEDHDCFYGECVVHPASGRGLAHCAAPCDAQGACDIPGTVCLDTDGDGGLDQDDHCFLASSGSECQQVGSSAECQEDEVCRSFSSFNGGAVCARDCSGLRQGGCGPGSVCVPHDEPNGFACYAGMPGLPCGSNGDCLSIPSLGLDLVCDGPAGQEICTESCSGPADCDWTARSVSSLGGYCRDLGDRDVCWPLFFRCSQSGPDPLLPCEQPHHCIDLDGDGIQPGFCTMECPAPRNDNPICPHDSGCTEWAGVGLDALCMPGYIGVPCKTNDQCLSYAGFECASITGLQEDGTCSMGCHDDLDCAAFADEMNAFCMPGMPDGEGRCFANPSIETYFGYQNGDQGTFCGFSPNTVCQPGHDCYQPPGQEGAVLDFCAEACSTQGSQCSTPGHTCAETGQGLYCLPTPGDTERAGRPAGERCHDHRQCASGVCRLSYSGSYQEQLGQLASGAAVCVDSR
jgi:hypothetical protein